MTNYCVHLNLRQMLALSNAEFDRLFGCNVSLAGKPVEAHEVKFYFEKVLAEGWEVYPLGQCGKFDKLTGCRGHVTKPKRKLKTKKIVAPGRAKGGHARAANLTPARRKEIARKAVAARWAKQRKGEPTNDAG